MSSHAGPGRRATRLTKLYVATWGILAAVAIAYLCVLAFRPTVGADIVKRVFPAQPEPTQVQRTLSKALAELQSVRQSIAEVWTQVGALKDTASRQEDQSRAVAALGHDVAELRTAIAGQDERGRVFAARLASVEARQAGGEGLPAQARASLQSPGSPRGPAAEMMGATVTGSVEERSSRARTPEARAASPQQQPREETKQAAAAPPAFGAPKVIAASPKAPVIAGLVGLQLATAPTTDALRLAWLRISSGHKDALQDLEPRYVEVKIATGVTYRLVAGPVGSSEEGVRMCAELKGKRVSCAVASYAGQPL